ncbi:carboxymuconolactone decarboxylase family protein [Thermus sediminis]|uniref:carboxymuconolactone decarboxylase family protein n=1 Tax=Thermus sediminis TaxID=1761908 RepID=UPI000E3BB742|nr:carboxymuconolactone decarboxylase family protein [Thermus sediminis]
MSVRKAIWGERQEAMEKSLQEVDPDLFRYIRDFAYEEVLARPGLDLKTRELLAITALIALGSPKELATHLEGALRVGAREEEVRETILQSALFLGFPQALAAMKLFHKVLKGRGAPHEGEG